MQLVGATRSFIRKPFIIRSVLHGTVGALLANVLLIITASGYSRFFTEAMYLQSRYVVLIVFGLVFLAGVVISFFSTYFAVNKFLKLRYDELFT